MGDGWMGKEEGEREDRGRGGESEVWEMEEISLSDLRQALLVHTQMYMWTPLEISRFGYFSHTRC